jgi:leucyl aminopeptidase
MTDDSTNEFLAHFGIKGMKWGIRNDPNRAATRQAARVQKAQARTTAVKQREANRQAEAKRQATLEKNRDTTIAVSRKALPESQRRLRIAKAQYRVDKHTMGKKAAKEILNKHKQTHARLLHYATQQTGKEQAEARAEAYRQLQYRQMMQQELERQRNREANAQLLRDLIAYNNKRPPADRTIIPNEVRSKTESPKHSAVGPRHRA